MASLTDLQTYEANILKALGNPTAEVWYDNFHKKSRPVGELQAALIEVRSEMAKLQPCTQVRVRRHLPRALSDL